MIYANDAARVLHADLILNRAGYAHVYDACRLYGCARLADLLLVRQPALIHGWAGSGQLPVEKLRQLTQHGEIILALYSSPAAYKQVGLVNCNG